jgi:hypothetical protein
MKIAEPIVKLGREPWREEKRGFSVFRRSEEGHGRPGQFQPRIRTKLPAILSSFRAGHATRRVQRDHGISLWSAIKIRALIQKREPLICRCGLPHGHHGFCRGTNPRSHWKDRGIALQLKFLVRQENEKHELTRLLREHGSLTVHQVRNLMGLRLTRAKALTQRLRAAGVLICKVRGRHSRYELATRRLSQSAICNLKSKIP